MANLVGIIDPDKSRRDHFLGAARPRLVPYPWLRWSELEWDNLALAWATHPDAPVSHALSPTGDASFVLGNFRLEGPPGPAVEAGSLLDPARANCSAPSRVASQNGFYVAILREPSGKVSIGTDMLGLFPVYYYSTQGGLIFSTVPSVFACWPGFQRRVDEHGLAGILLTMHLTGGRTLWRGVRRLESGYALRWEPGQAAREIHCRSLQGSMAHFGKSTDELLDMLDHLFREAVRSGADAGGRHVLLSGGLDSRLVSGYLRQLARREAMAVTFGNPGDIDMSSAAKVARRLGWRHARHAVDYSRFAETAVRIADSEHLSNGFNEIGFAVAVPFLHGLTIKRLLTGFLGDPVMGGGHLRWGYDPATREYGFEPMFNTVNRWGFPPNVVARLLRPVSNGECVREVIENLRQFYEARAGLDFHRPWLFDLHHRQRLHVAAIAWRIAFAAWPVLPFTETQLLEACLGLPAPSVLGRRLQKEMLCRFFPKLAALPLDRSSPDSSPLLPPWHARLFGRRPNRLVPALAESDRRYYFRILNINNPGWVSVRREAERFRRNLGELLDPSALDELLPPPDVEIPSHHGIEDVSGHKTLLGLMLWAGRSL